jgi:UDP-galactopyranose mutase
MAAPAARMRLTVDVLPLAEEDSHGPYRHVALAAFKGRKFALPVQLDNTIEQVWTQIEERYKRNYLTPAQASYAQNTDNNAEIAKLTVAQELHD